MKKIIANVYEETDYSVFKRLDDNRDVFSKRVEKLIASISERYILNPIIVNEKMEIVDGQGRFEARKSMHLPIHYIVVPGATSADCRRMNKYNTRWTQLDYAKSYAKGGNENYVRLLEACKETGLPLSRILRLTNHGNRSSHPENMGMSLFEAGRLIFTNNDKETVGRIKVMADEIIDALQFTFRPNDAFYTGVKICAETERYDHSRMLRRCREERTSYSQMANLGAQLKEFERIYNKGFSSKGKVYFSDYMRTRGSNTRDYSKGYTPYADVDISTLD